jgi:Ca2+-binding RTX toxin-like protein
MSSNTYSFDIINGIVTNMYKLVDGQLKPIKFGENTSGVFDATTNVVTITETKPTGNEIKTYALVDGAYVLASESFTDPSGNPIVTEVHGNGFDDSNQDGFDDDDMDQDGSEDDHLTVSDSNHSLHGKGGDDLLEGNQGDDSLDGGSGSDDLNGEAGDDRLAGGTGDDNLSGGDGDDSLTGDDGDDDMLGGSGNDSLKGGKGDDTLDAGSGNDSVDGGSGDDQIVAGLGAGDDRYNGGSGTDSVDYSGALAGVTVNLAKGFASSSDDGDLAGIGKDKLRNIEDAVGGDSNDILIGSKAANSLDGGNGNDLIIGGAKSDSLTGGDGADTFKFLKVSDSSVSAHDVINDFSAGDVIDLSSIDAKKGFEKNDSFTFISDPNAVTQDNANGAVWFKDGMLYASTDGDVAAEFQVELSGVVTLTEASLIL